jgi:capsular exopolysaccharide synthesis family protein
MSRIDEALRAAERAAREERGLLSPVERVASSRRATLEEYVREGAGKVEEAARRASFRSGRPPRTTEIGRRATDSGADLAGEPKLLPVDGATPVALEQYRRLAAALHDAQVENDLRTVMVTSALPREGKTLTVVNLGVTLSESYGRRVLLIDADLRWPSLHEVLGLANDTGLTEALLEARSEIRPVEISPRLSVLPAGQAGAQPLAGLTSERMGAILDECETRFDWVLLDTPPVGLLPDARLLARLIRAVVLVIGAGSTPASVVERAVAQLGSDSIVGAVLNGVDERMIPDADYYANDRQTVRTAGLLAPSDRALV